MNGAENRKTRSSASPPNDICMRIATGASMRITGVDWSVPLRRPRQIPSRAKTVAAATVNRSPQTTNRCIPAAPSDLPRVASAFERGCPIPERSSSKFERV